ncbi:MAG: biotin/lipoyl-containing protein [Thermodesulfobacteriota bacterium]
MRYDLTIGEQQFSVEIVEIRGKTAHVFVDGRPFEIQMGGLPDSEERTGSAFSRNALQKIESSPSPPGFSSPHPARPSFHAGLTGETIISAPIPGLILEIKVKPGDPVNAGQVVATMEAMKMENALSSPVAGKVKEIKVEKGSQVATGDLIMIIQ